MARLVAEYDLELDWRGFELHPRTPVGGMAIAELFRGADLGAMQARMQAFAAGFGVTEMASHSRLPNTRRALAVAELARDEGLLHPLRDAVMVAHWEEARDIEDLDVLAELARDAGLDPDAARAAADAPEYKARIDAIRLESQRIGVTGIPTFIFGTIGGRIQATAAVGCQPYEHLAAAAEKAGARKRSA